MDLDTSKCQHCGQAVTFGMTEHGFRGFVHTANGLSACPLTKQQELDEAYTAAHKAGWTPPFARRVERLTAELAAENGTRSWAAK